MLPAIDLNGDIITLANLPASNDVHWTPNKKSIVVGAVHSKIISLEEVFERYSMDKEEFTSWEEGISTHGARGVMITKSQQINRRGPIKK